MQGYQGRGPKVKHHIKSFGQLLRFPTKINRTSHFADSHAVAVRGAFVAVNLIAQVNGAFGTNRHTGIAAGTQIKINRIILLPSRFKSAQPAFKGQLVTAYDGVLALLSRKTFCG